MITETPLNNFDFKPKNSKLNYPQCRCGNCPQFYFNLLSVASRGSGKTYNICKLISHYEQNKLVDNDGITHPLRTIVISPTFDANPIFKNLKSLDMNNDIHTSYTDELLQSIVDDIKKNKDETEKFSQYKKAYQKVMNIPETKLNSFFKSHPDIYDILAEEDFENPKNINQPKYEETPVNIIILDDLMATGAFTSKRLSSLTNNLIKNRHNGIVFCLLVQALKGSVPKNIRLNCNVFFIGKFASKKILEEDFWEEVSNVLTLEQLNELYDKATEEQYGSLIIDCSRKEKRFFKGLDAELKINNICL